MPATYSLPEASRASAAAPSMSLPPRKVQLQLIGGHRLVRVQDRDKGVGFAVKRRQLLAGGP